MARCGCAGGACDCVIVSGDNVTVTGSGSAENPYVINIGGVAVGPAGPQGVRGTLWYVSNAPYPDPSDVPVLSRNTGDLFLYPTSGDIFRWDGDSWEYAGTLA